MSLVSKRKRVLITVRTYPTPAKKGVEVSCTAGITDDGRWIRLYPVAYRLMDVDKRFAKYQWVELEAKKRQATHAPRASRQTSTPSALWEKCRRNKNGGKERKSSFPYEIIAFAASKEPAKRKDHQRSAYSGRN